MHRDLFWAKRAQKIRFFQMKKYADIIIEKQICDTFTIKDGSFENAFAVDKYIINTVKKISQPEMKGCDTFFTSN